MMRQASTAARLCQYKNSPPQAMPAAGFAILKGHFTIHQITKKQLPCGFSWLLLGWRQRRARLGARSVAIHRRSGSCGSRALGPLSYTETKQYESV
jgi:hypothetical protein